MKHDLNSSRYSCQSEGEEKAGSVGKVGGASGNSKFVKHLWQYVSQYVVKQNIGQLNWAPFLKACTTQCGFVWMDNVNSVELKLVGAINDLAKKTTRLLWAVSFWLTWFSFSTDYHVPSEYRINSFIRDKVKTVTLHTEFPQAGNFHTFCVEVTRFKDGQVYLFPYRSLFFSPSTCRGYSNMKSMRKA